MVLVSVKEWWCWPRPLTQGTLAASAVFALGPLLLFKAMLQISHAFHLQPIYRTVPGLSGLPSTERGLLGMGICAELLTHFMAPCYSIRGCHSMWGWKKTGFLQPFPSFCACTRRTTILVYIQCIFSPRYLKPLPANFFFFFQPVNISRHLRDWFLAVAFKCLCIWPRK